MANALYDSSRQKFLEGSIAWLTDTIKVALVKTAYAVNLATDQFVTDLGANILVRSSALTTKTSTAGVADADDVLYAALSGAQVSYIVVYKDTGADATSPLIAYYDTATGMPFTPSGGDVTVQWSAGASKMFKL